MFWTQTVLQRFRFSTIHYSLSTIMYTLSTYFKTLLLISTLLLTTGWSSNSPATSSSVFTEIAQQTGGSSCVLDKNDPNFAALFEACVGAVLQCSIEQPTILSLSPMQLPQGSTSEVLITACAQFNSSSVGNIAISGMTVSGTKILSITQIMAKLTIPPNTPVGAYDIQITTLNNGTQEVVKGSKMLQVVAPSSSPTVLSASPSYLSKNVTTEVRLYGQKTNFSNATTLEFGGCAITGVVKSVPSPTELVATLNVSDTANTGFCRVTLKTGAEVAKDNSPQGVLQVFAAIPLDPKLTSITPYQGHQGETITVAFNGQDTHFATSSVVQIDGLSVVSSPTIISPTELTAALKVGRSATLGWRNVQVTTATEKVTLLNGFNVLPPTATFSIDKTQGYRGNQMPLIYLYGKGTHWVQGKTQMRFDSATGMTVSVNVIDATQAVANLTIASDAALEPRDMMVITESEVAVTTNGEQFEIKETSDCLLSLSPNQGRPGDTLTDVVLTCQNANFADFNDSTTVSFGGGILVNKKTLDPANPNKLTLTLYIPMEATPGVKEATVRTGAPTLTLATSVNALTVLTAIQHEVTVKKTGPGKVTSQPASIDCGTLCTTKWSQGTKVTLTATPDSNSQFVKWVGDCNGTQNSVSVTIDGAKNCEAQFVTEEYSLTITKQGQGTITSSLGGFDCAKTATVCQAKYIKGMTLTLGTEEAAVSWSGDCVANGGKVELKMDKDKNCGAVFDEACTNTDNSANPCGVTSDHPGEPAPSTTTITAHSPTEVTPVVPADETPTSTPESPPTTDTTGNGATDTSTAGTGASTTDTDAKDSATADTGVKDTDKNTDNEELPPPETKHLQVTLTGTGHGTVNSDQSEIDCDGLTHCSYDYLTGTQVILMATPDDYSTFVGWGEDCEGSQDYATITLDANRNCTANFEALGKSVLQFTHSQMPIDEYGTVSTTLKGQEVLGHLITVEVSRTHDKQGAISTDYQIVSDQQATEGEDYVVLSPRTLTWGNGDNTVKTISLFIVNDCVKEGEEQFGLQLTNPTGLAELGYPTSVSITLQEADATATCDCQTPALAVPPAQTKLTLVNDGRPLSLSFSGVKVVNVSNPKVVTVANSSTGVEITPLEVGETQFVLEDCAGKQVTFTVTVEPGCTALVLPLEQPAVTLSLGEGPQMVTLPAAVQPVVEGFDKTIVNAVLTGQTLLQLTPYKVGSTEVTLVDCESNKVTMKVTVEEMLCESDSVIQPASRDLTMGLNDSPLTLSFSGGQGKIMPKGGYDEQVITLDSIHSEEGFIQFKITPRQEGQTQLTLEDSQCPSKQAIVNVQVVDVCETSSPLQPADSHFTFIKGDASVSPIFIGGQGKLQLSEVPDATVVDLALPFYSEDGMTQLTLTPRQAGTTYLSLIDECQKSARVGITVLKPSTWAYYCHLAERTDGICEHPDNQKVLKSNSTATDAEGKGVDRAAYFEVQPLQAEVLLPTDQVKLQVTTISETLQDQAADLVVMVENNQGQFFMYQGRTTAVVSPPVVGDEKETTDTGSDTPVEEEPPTPEEPITPEPPPEVEECPPELSLWCDAMSETRATGTRLPTQWQEWDGQIASLQALRSFDSLSAIMEIPLELELQGLPVGEYTVSIGYRLPNGVVVFNGFSQLRFWIANSQSLPSKTDTRAFFAGDVQRDAVTAIIKPDRNHLGQLVDIVMVALYFPPQGEMLSFMRLADLRWLEWNLQSIETLMPAIKNVTLSNDLPVEVFKGNLSGLSGMILVYVGYEIGEKIVFNGKAPIEIMLP